MCELEIWFTLHTVDIDRLKEQWTHLKAVDVLLYDERSTKENTDLV
jgi:hypothetical protein